MLQAETILPGVLMSRIPLFPKDTVFVNNYVLIGNEGTLVWDTLHDPQAIASQSEVYQKPVTAVYSHADWDHCLGTDGFGFEHIVAHQNALARFGSELRAEMRKVARKQPQSWQTIRLVPPEITFSQSMTLGFGSFEAELFHIGGHTTDSILGLVPELRLLLTGDAVETVPFINDAASVPKWLQGLEKLSMRDDFDLILPGHGDPAGRELLEENIHYLRRMLSGEACEIETADPFYLKTHQNNLELLRTTHERKNG